MIEAHGLVKRYGSTTAVNGWQLPRLINIFRFDDEGRLVEEFVRTDYRSFLRQLGAQGA
jgi:hypothetical protein